MRLAHLKQPPAQDLGNTIAKVVDEPVIEMNEEALAQLNCEKELKIVPLATHLFEEPGALEKVARLATDWVRKHLTAESGEVIEA